MKPIEGAKMRENPDPGAYQFRFCSIIDYGTQRVTTNYEGKEKVRDVRQVNIGYEILGERTTEGEQFVLFQTYTLSASKKAKLMEHLSAWYGKPADELDLADILGKYGNFVVVHNKSEKTKKTYANIASLSPLKKNEKPSEKGKEPLIYLSLNDGEFDRDTFDALPDWQQTLISGTKEFAEVDEAPKKKKKK